MFVINRKLIAVLTVLAIIKETCASTATFPQLTDYEKTLSFLRSKIKVIPDVLLICGSGLAELADTLTDPLVIPYGDIPLFNNCTAPGHVSNLVFGKLSGKNVMCMQGRFHTYEGYSIKDTTLPVRIAALLGVKNLLATNNAGGLNSNFQAGDVMIIKDHINFPGFSGLHPSLGANDPRLGNRFYAMNRAYDRTLISKMMNIRKDMGLADNTHEGVYAMLCGPSYETVAELKMLNDFGVDAVGMSTIPEVLEARHSNMTVLAFTFVSTLVIVSYDDDKEVNEEDVLRNLKEHLKEIKEFVRRIVKEID